MPTEYQSKRLKRKRHQPKREPTTAKTLARTRDSERRDSNDAPRDKEGKRADPTPTGNHETFDPRVTRRCRSDERKTISPKC